ncbi:MAG TPA: LuxR C-terminal-related transcriptional regulator [Ornithinibacter sp.]|nr:LuxR C-terminal-related transcriptional regulator [Ornithinibacter sp.]
MADLRTALAVPRPKVSVPRRIDRAVERPRLLRDLTGAPFDDPSIPSGRDLTQGPVVLLACAPAGYGKTTMLADFADDQRAAGVPVAWVTCDRDDDSTAFWSAVLVAATEAAPDSATMLAGLDAPAGPTDSTFVANLIGVFADEVPGLLLVLDDVHEVRARAVLDGIQHLVEWADGRVRVALGCRFEPPIGLHRLRLTGRLHEVRAAQLAFTAEEADDFWGRHDIVLDGDSRGVLHTLIEGWPAGMRMAALSLEHGDPATFVAEFSGADRPVADYLASEVLVRLPDDVVDFLLRTSVVEDLAVDLAARLSGRDDSAAMLDDLAQRNALVVPLDRSGTWFRYHALLRTYLAAALQRRDPAELATLQRVAALWFLEQRDPAQALELASVAGDTELVEQILLTHGLGLVLAGAGPTVRRSIAVLPVSAERTPAVLVHRALLAVDEGDVVAADEALAMLAAVPDDGGSPRMTALRKAAALHRARLAADLAVAHASDLVEDVGPSHLPADLDPDVRLLVLADRGALHLFEGDHRRARRDLQQAIELARAAGLHSVQLYCSNLVAGTYVAENDFAQARISAERAIAFAAARGWDRTPSMAYSYMLAGWTAFQMLHPEEAATWAAISLDVIDTTIDVEVEGAARTGEAIIAFDEPPQRRSALDRLERTTAWLTDRGASPALTALAAPHELRMCLSLGEWHRAERAVERAETRLGTSGDVVVLQAQLASARGRPADARRLLRPVLSGGLTPIRSTALVSAWLLEALLAERSERRPAATEALQTALQVAAPAGASRPFFDAGAEVHAMLSALRGRAGHLEQSLDSVLAGIAHVLEWQGGATAATSGLPLGTTTAPSGGWLTERELVVLRDLPSMMTLGEIATAQGISLNTVKTHVRSIYAKLGAGTRREAIGIARGLGLL